MTPDEFMAMFGQAHDSRDEQTLRRRFDSDVLQVAGVLRDAVKAAYLAAMSQKMVNQVVVSCYGDDE